MQYEPEVFPGLVYRMHSPKVTFLIFVSGKIVVTGAKSEKIIQESFTEIYKIVHKFKKANYVGEKKKPPADRPDPNPNNVSVR